MNEMRKKEEIGKRKNTGSEEETNTCLHTMQKDRKSKEWEDIEHGMALKKEERRKMTSFKRNRKITVLKRRINEMKER